MMSKLFPFSTYIVTGSYLQTMSNTQMKKLKEIFKICPILAPSQLYVQVDFGIPVLNHLFL